TQYMDEADRLAEDIVVIDRGRKIAHGTPDELKKQIGGEWVEVVLATGDDIPPAQSILASLAVGEVQLEEQARRLTAGVTGGADVLRHALQRLADANIEVVDVGLRRPTLDDVFLSLTGHSAEEVSEPDGDDAEGPESDQTDQREKEAVR
ncbi:MAG: DUF4162 domain-containing protein, partial [Actinomycetota bacterium]|nr:DUF4162 domain-containing protein [Actinomycetota bacterium]